MNKEEFAMKIGEIRLQLYKTARLYLGTEASAMEAVDESVYKAFKGLKKLRQEEYFTTWITRILINECKKELKRRSRVSIEVLPERVEAEQFDNLSLQEAIGKLPEQVRQVIILRYFSGMTLKETAETLKIPQGTAVTRQRRGLQLLRLEFVEVEDDGK